MIGLLCLYSLTLEQFCQSSSILKHVSLILPFLLLSIIPLYRYTTFYLSIHPLMVIWVTSTFRLLCVTLPRTSMYQYCCCCKVTFSIILGACLEVKFLSHMATLFYRILLSLSIKCGEQSL